MLVFTAAFEFVVAFVFAAVLAFVAVFVFVAAFALITAINDNCTRLHPVPLHHLRPINYDTCYHPQIMVLVNTVQ